MIKLNNTIWYCFLILCFVSLDLRAQNKSDRFIVIDGKPNAEIIIDDNPKRAVSFAAKELQHYIKQISGATLPIYLNDTKIEKTSNKSNIEGKAKEFKNKIFIGESHQTKRLGITHKHLDWGAYKIESGPNWLVLIGQDSDFSPKGIWAKNRSNWNKRVKHEWDKSTNYSGWGNTIARDMWNKYNSELNLWAYDEKGSLNAVYGFLRHLGVRWFMPGELGEYVPIQKDIKFLELCELVKPEFKIRKASFMRYGNNSSIQPDILWSLRQGMNYPYGFDIYHGMSEITRSEKNRKEHPEYYALYNGKRATEGKTPEPCLSSQGLFEENLKFIRYMFDTYDVPAYSVWPDDGFTRMCECDKCVGKDTPERGPNGKLSDYVWEYVNNIAVEIEKTHPDKYIIGGAYSTYWLPPTEIKKLNSNIIVHVVNGRRRYDEPDDDAIKYNFTKEQRLNYVKKWSDLADNKIINFMNFGGAANTPNIFGEDIYAIKDFILGEDMWVSHDKGALAIPGFNHLNYYISARMWWNPELDLDEFLNEYYDAFYGPAAEEMKEFINYFEVHQRDFGSADKIEVLKKGLELFCKAKDKIDYETIYGQRILAFEKGIEKYQLRYDQLKIERDDVPSIRANAPLDRITDIKIDGNLDEEFWRFLNGSLSDNKTGEKPRYSTKFRVGIRKNYLYIGISSKDKPGKPMNISTTKDDNPKIWDGDYIDILIETPVNSFYQISVNPAGAVTDYDRGNSGYWGLRWQSNIEMAYKVDEKNGTWNIEARMPLTTSQQDPLHEIIGVPPRENFPWFINVCRKRIDENGVEYLAFSPTKTDTFLVNNKLARIK